jgi:thiamine biosynthesis lipoprotein
MAKSPKPDRRELLTGRFAGRAGISEGDTQPGPTTSAGAPAFTLESPGSDDAAAKTTGVREAPSQFNMNLDFLEHYSHAAMACQFAIFANLNHYSQLSAAALAAFEAIDQIEDQWSIFRHHSELSRINRGAFLEWMAIDPSLFELLTRADLLRRQTNGAFDITSGRLSDIWGFSNRQPRVPTCDVLNRTMAGVGGHHIHLREHDRSIRFDNESTAINLGGIGKGYAIDVAVSEITRHGVGDFLIHGGQSSAVARGRRRPNENLTNNDGWTVGLSNPLVPGTRLAEFYLRNEALGTSGTARQGFFHQGKRYGHIIDPRTGWPASRWLSSTVICSNAENADALATALFVMSPTEISEFCLEHKDLKVVLVQSHDNTNKIAIRTFNLAASDWRLLSPVDVV